MFPGFSYPGNEARLVRRFGLGVAVRGVAAWLEVCVTTIARDRQFSARRLVIWTRVSRLRSRCPLSKGPPQNGRKTQASDGQACSPGRSLSRKSLYRIENTAACNPPPLVSRARARVTTQSSLARRRPRKAFRAQISGSLLARKALRQSARLGSGCKQGSNMALKILAVRDKRLEYRVGIMTSVMP